MATTTNKNRKPVPSQKWGLLENTTRYILEALYLGSLDNRVKLTSFLHIAKQANVETLKDFLPIARDFLQNHGIKHIAPQGNEETGI